MTYEIEPLKPEVTGYLNTDLQSPIPIGPLIYTFTDVVHQQFDQKLATGIDTWMCGWSLMGEAGLKVPHILKLR